MSKLLNVVRKRISQSTVDWPRFAAVFPKSQIDTFRIIKAKHDNFINMVHLLPERLPSIDFDSYKSRLPDPTMADRFRKSYESLKIPYPTDTDGMLKVVEAENNEMEVKVKEFINDVQQEIDESQTFLSKINDLPQLKEMTAEVYGLYFPDATLDPERPTIWPHIEEDQPYNKAEGSDH